VDVEAALEDEGDDGHTFMNTPLHWSAYKGHMATTLSLLDAGYNLADVDSVGNTPLHLAAMSRNLAVVELLLSSGADPLTRNRYQLTSLDVATAPAVREVLAKVAKQKAVVSLVVLDAASEQQERQRREAMRKAESLSLRSIAGSLNEVMGREVPESLGEEEARIAELEAARKAAVATNGVVDAAIIAAAEAEVKRFQLSSEMRRHLSSCAEQHPVVTQRAYGAYINKLERFVKAGERANVHGGLLAAARAVIRRGFAEFWLGKVEAELRGVECAEPSLEPRINILGQRIAAAESAGASDSLVVSATKLLDRFRSEVALKVHLAGIPPYKMPPAADATAELNKKQLAAFLAEYWTECDLGKIKETTAEDKCHPFPLPPGFGKADDDEEWNTNPLKALVNTPEGYIWIPSTALMRLREAAKEMDVAIIRATNLGAYEPQVDKARVKLQEIEADIQQLELKDETDMTLAEAAAAKASKKLRAALKKKK